MLQGGQSVKLTGIFLPVFLSFLTQIVEHVFDILLSQCVIRLFGFTGGFFESFSYLVKAIRRRLCGEHTFPIRASVKLYRLCNAIKRRLITLS